MLISPEGTFRHGDGSPATWTKWKSGQPDNETPVGNDEADCVVYLNGEMSDIRCASTRRYVCYRGKRTSLHVS